MTFIGEFTRFIGESKSSTEEQILIENLEHINDFFSLLLVDTSHIDSSLMFKLDTLVVILNKRNEWYR
ncbi:hypothetical protein [Neobacillus bataviensis]|uniref:hypothetical protein n=1 Tax=Neobacillus bataviensis TaxID=220685 RepID=UPI001CBF0904|nr:hypothetical protein [Neobacillus bataviensis]